MVTGLILHVSTREQKSVPINIISIRLACVLSFRNNVDCRLLWDVLKIDIREATIIYCKSKSKFNREARRSLEKELQDLSSLL
jgi:predicted membrane chloride channel (bestrophin family)